MTLSIAITIMSVVYISILYCNNNDNVIIMITIIKVIKTIVILVIIVMIMMTTMIIIIIIVIVIIYSDNSQIVIIVIQSWYIMIIIMVYHDNYNKCTITITQKNMTYVLKISPHLYIIYIYTIKNGDFLCHARLGVFLNANHPTQKAPFLPMGGSCCSGARKVVNHCNHDHCYIFLLLLLSLLTLLFLLFFSFLLFGILLSYFLKLYVTDYY